MGEKKKEKKDKEKKKKKEEKEKATVRSAPDGSDNKYSGEELQNETDHRVQDKIKI